MFPFPRVDNCLLLIIIQCKHPRPINKLHSKMTDQPQIVYPMDQLKLISINNVVQIVTVIVIFKQEVHSVELIFSGALEKEFLK